MKIGFISDAHGNPEGLGRCLGTLQARGADRICFLGDAVGYLPEVNEVLDLLRSSGASCIRGNHEAMLLGELAIPEGREAIYRHAQARELLSEEHRRWIHGWPETLLVECDRKQLLLFHGSPDDHLQGYVYADSDLASFRELPFDGVFMGHTHRPFVANAGPVSVVNVGSCGMPRDAGNLSSCAIYDSETGNTEILRVPFDAEALVLKWGDRIDPAAAACLRRPAPHALYGTILSR